MFFEKIIEHKSNIQMVDGMIVRCFFRPSLRHDAASVAHIVIELFVEKEDGLAGTEIGRAEVGVFETFTLRKLKLILVEHRLAEDFVGRRQIGIVNDISRYWLETVVFERIIVIITSFHVSMSLVGNTDFANGEVGCAFGNGGIHILAHGGFVVIIGIAEHYEWCSGFF